MNVFSLHTKKNPSHGISLRAKWWNGGKSIKRTENTIHARVSYAMIYYHTKKITFEYRTNCDCEREETRGNVEELCDKSIYETSHSISKKWEKPCEGKSHTWFACVRINLVFYVKCCHTHREWEKQEEKQINSSTFFCYFYGVSKNVVFICEILN